MSTPDAEYRILRRAACWLGLVTRAEIRAEGLSDKQIRLRVRAGKLEELRPGVFRIGGTPLTWHQQLMAAHLWTGDGSAVSHRAAATLLGMPGFEAGIIELSSPIRRGSLPGGGILHFVSCLDPIDVTRKHGIP